MRYDYDCHRKECVWYFESEEEMHLFLQLFTDFLDEEADVHYRFDGK